MRELKLTISTAILLFSLTACERNTSVLGPDISKIYGEFEIEEAFSISDKEADFANGDLVIFSAKFSAYAEWELTITGAQTGAFTKFTGDRDQVNISWDGFSSVIPVLTAEKCEVRFIIPSEEYAVVDSLEIITKKVNEGVLVTDFEDGVNPAWPHFYQSGVSFYADASGSAPEGDIFFNAGGTVPWDYLIGLVEFTAESEYSQPHFPLGQNQHQIYFNAMMGGDSELPASFVLWRFYEDDNLDGTWDPNAEDMWVSPELFVDYDGWRLTSLRYDSLTISASGAGSAGNQIYEPEKLHKVEYLLLIDPTLGAARANLDYLIFTEGGPLKP